MSRPTDSELNRAMAEVIGYRVLPWAEAIGSAPPDSRRRGEYLLCKPDGTIVSTHGRQTPDRAWLDGPDFCHDRNQLPEILDAVEAAGRQWSMATRLDKDLGKGVVDSAWIMWRLPMREVVEAALRSLGAWRSEWDSEEEAHAAADGRPVLPLVVTGREGSE